MCDVSQAEKLRENQFGQNAWNEGEKGEGTVGEVAEFEGLGRHSKGFGLYSVVIDND